MDMDMDMDNTAKTVELREAFSELLKVYGHTRAFMAAKGESPPLAFQHSSEEVMKIVEVAGLRDSLQGLLLIYEATGDHVHVPKASRGGDCAACRAKRALEASK